MMRWRNRGIESAIRIVKAIVVGDGDRSEDIRSSKDVDPPISSSVRV